MFCGLHLLLVVLREQLALCGKSIFLVVWMYCVHYVIVHLCCAFKIDKDLPFWVVKAFILPKLERSSLSHWLGNFWSLHSLTKNEIPKLSHLSLLYILRLVKWCFFVLRDSPPTCLIMDEQPKYGGDIWNVVVRLLKCLFWHIVSVCFNHHLSFASFSKRFQQSFSLNVVHWLSNARSLRQVQ